MGDLAMKTWGTSAVCAFLVLALHICVSVHMDEPTGRQLLGANAGADTILLDDDAPEDTFAEAGSPETALVAELVEAPDVVPGASIRVPPANASTARTFSLSKAA